MSDPLPSPAVREQLPLLRILDANLNRATEGLRVVEEYTRFVLNDETLTSACKQIRHALTAISRKAFVSSDLLTARDSSTDVGTGVQTTSEYERADITEVVTANLKRVEQSLRALEEYGKIVSPDAAKAIEQLRYRMYTLAKALGEGGVRGELLAGARLYVLIDGQSTVTALDTLAEAVITGGVRVIQLRDKMLSDRELLARAQQLRTLTRNRCLLIMNDRPDLAVLADADGVHVGQEELSVRDVRTIVGPRRLVGVSTHSLAQAQQAVADGADYIGCGPTFTSRTKHFDDFPGLHLLRDIAANIRLPAFAIGGITSENLDQVLATGISRVAVSAAITQAEHPKLATQALAERLESQD